MRKFILVLLLTFCVSFVVFAQVGKYQLASGKYLQSVMDMQKENIENSYTDGLFRINTETGLVEEYAVHTTIDEAGNFIIKTGWEVLTNTKGKISKKGELLK